MLGRRNLGKGLLTMAVAGISQQALGHVRSRMNAQWTPGLPPMTGGFGLVDPVVPPGGKPLVYSSTTAQPTWLVEQWSIADRLSPWNYNKSTSAAATITINADRSITLSQDTGVISCLNGNKPREFDLFISPRRINAPIPLTCSAIRLSVDVEMILKPGKSATPACQVNQGGILVGIILTNEIAHQTIFYQINFRTGSLQNGQVRQGTSSNSHNWYFRKNPFGVDDFSAQAAVGTTRLVTSFDLLTRIKTVVADAPDGLDADIGRWAVTAVYAGQHTWGSLAALSHWRDFQMWYLS